VRRGLEALIARPVFYELAEMAQPRDTRTAAWASAQRRLVPDRPGRRGLFMTESGMTPEERRAWITSRLDPIHLYDPSLADPVRSDYDLNPGLRMDSPHALRPAAVLVGLIEREEGLTVLLTRRSDTMRSHTGQIAFPGGRCDPGETPWQTALREAQEEVGLDPKFVTLSGLLHGYQTVTGFHVTPVVGFIDPKASSWPARKRWPTSSRRRSSS
jgi:8-oxo-dGTP pyrophosphatase MutT (NUDIX family)